MRSVSRASTCALTSPAAVPSAMTRAGPSDAPRLHTDDMDMMDMMTWRCNKHRVANADVHVAMWYAMTN